MSHQDGDLGNRLHALLRDAQMRAGEEFCGLGVVVSEDPSSLPVFPIGPEIGIAACVDAAALLGAISVACSPHHDGFHILGSDLEPIALSQYFSPPVVPRLTVDRTVPFGGRYLAALFGSTIEGVLATGIATPGLGVIVFIKGKESIRTI